MQITAMNSGRRRELVMIALLCLLGGLRVFLFSAGFPLFTNVDEMPHYSMILAYADGDIPAGMEPYRAGPARIFIRYGSPEYLDSPERASQGLAPTPLAAMPPGIADAIVAWETRKFLTRPNIESTQPPVYYSIAAAWGRLGEFCGLTDVRLAYWLRFLNVPLYLLLIWAAYASLKRIYAGNPLLYLGVPLLVAFFPQDVFYQMSNDVLTPLLFTAAFYLLVRIHLEGDKSLRLHLLTGLTIAALLLVKFSNVTILVPLLVIALLSLRKARSAGRLQDALFRNSLLLLAAATPVLLWLLRNYAVTGELGSGYEKAQYLGWTHKPLAEFFHHPVFSSGGAWTFITELLTTFWRGELVWHRAPIRMALADGFYIVSTLLFMAAAVIALAEKRSERPAEERFAGWIGAAVIAVSVLMMLGFSTVFDFGDCFYPSTSHPYFTSGRLLAGVLVPFLVLYITGLDWLMTRARLTISRFAVLIATVVLITASEIAISLPAFQSVYNWFHL